jgi:hypothetical protein
MSVDCIVADDNPFSNDLQNPTKKTKNGVINTWRIF